MTTLIAIAIYIGFALYRSRESKALRSRDEVPTTADADARYALIQAPTFLVYSSGSQVFSTTSLANVTGTEIAFATTGLYEFEFLATYNAAATTTGSGWGINLSGGATQNYLSLITIMSVSQGGAMNVSPASTQNGAIFNASSRFTTGNTAIIKGHINVTATGNILLRCMSEIGGSNITVTDVIGFVKLKSQ